MRRSHVWKVLFMSGLLLSIILLLTKEPPPLECPDPSNPYIQERDTQHQKRRLFDVQEDALQMLNLPYKYLLGASPTTKRFLTIGISSVKREKENYLLSTLGSIFNHCSQKELDQLLVVIYLANAQHSLNTNMAEEIQEQFSAEISAGRLIAISSYREAYPPLEGLKRNYNDHPERVAFRSKQNVDYAFLVNSCSNFSQYYLMLEDDVACSMNFLSIIKSYVSEYSSSWTTITFSNLGYIGKLYHNDDLPKLARFLLLFYDEMPCDWLLDLFYKSKAQGKIIQYKPSLFQHMGKFSSFQGSLNKLKDKDFAEVIEKFGDYPLASCLTNMKAYQDYSSHYPCFPSNHFFWAINITADNYFTMVFHYPTDIEKIRILTGNSDHPSDTLKSGYVELGRHTVQEPDCITCESFTKIGDFQNGTFFLNNIDPAVGGSIDCLKIQVSAPQANWLIIQKVGIWVNKKKIQLDNAMLSAAVLR